MRKLRLYEVNIYMENEPFPMVVLAESWKEACFKANKPWKIGKGLRPVEEFR